MIKLRKSEILATIESALFVIGAIFFMVVFINSDRPQWAFWVGLTFAVAGAIVWLVPIFKNAFAQDVDSDAEELLPITDEAPITASGDYELHRPAATASTDHTAGDDFV